MCEFSELAAAYTILQTIVDVVHDIVLQLGHEKAFGGDPDFG
jgi:hypothetical protein